MRPLIFEPAHALAFIAVFLWAFLPEFRMVRQAQKAVRTTSAQDRGSLRSITLFTTLAWFVAMPAAARALRYTIGMRELAFVTGLLLLVAGSLLRRLCWRTLGEYFTGNVAVRAEQPVVQAGPYRLVRHPSYSAAMLMYLGIGLAIGNWVSLLAMLVLPLLGYAHRMRVEEAALVGTIGQPYVEYMGRTKRLIPWVV